jgi:tetratricopeptide (TPR) repeat protein
MSGFWDLRGQYTEGRTRLTAALARGSEPTAARARALRSAGFMAWTQGDHDAATTWCQESLALYRRLGMQAEAGMCLQQLGQTAFQQEDFAGAREFLREALEIASAGSGWGRSRSSKRTTPRPGACSMPACSPAAGTGTRRWWS